MLFISEFFMSFKFISNLMYPINLSVILRITVVITLEKESDCINWKIGRFNQYICSKIDKSEFL